MKGGPPIKLDGEDIYFVPMKAGPKGQRIRDAMTALAEIDPKAEEANWDLLSARMVDLATAMLEPNYGAEKAQELAGEVPLGWLQDLSYFAQFARWRPDFTQALGEAES